MKKLLIFICFMLSQFSYAAASYYEDENAVYFVEDYNLENIFYVPKLKMYLKKSTAPSPTNRVNYSAGMKFSTKILTKRQLYAVRPSWEGFGLTPYRVKLKSKCVFSGVIPGVYNNVIEASNVNNRDIGAGDGVDPCRFLFGVVKKYRDMVLLKLEKMLTTNTLISLDSRFDVDFVNSDSLELKLIHDYLSTNILSDVVKSSYANFIFGQGSEVIYDIAYVVGTFDKKTKLEYVDFVNESFFVVVNFTKNSVKISKNSDAVFYYNKVLSRDSFWLN